VSTRKKIRNAEDDLDVLNARKKSLQRAVVMISNLVPDGEKEPLTAPKEKAPIKEIHPAGTTTGQSGK
jgi:hypothetical protein